MFRHRIKFHILILPFVLYLMTPNQASAQSIEVQGRVNGYWGRENSPVVVRNDIIIPEGETLQIGPGVKVVFQKYSRLTVEGRLLAFGGREVESNIIFTSIRDREFLTDRDVVRPDRRSPQPGNEWQYISFENQDMDQMSQMENVVIRFSTEAIRCRDSYPMLRNIYIERTPVENRMFFNDEYVDIVQGNWTDYNTAEIGLRCEVDVSKTSYFTQDELMVTLSVTNVSDKQLFGIQIPRVKITGDANLEMIGGVDQPIEKLDIDERRFLTRIYKIDAQKNTNFNLEFFVYTFAKGEAWISNFAQSDTLTVFNKQLADAQTDIRRPEPEVPIKTEAEERDLPPLRVSGRKPFYKQWWFWTPVAAGLGASAYMMLKGDKGGPSPTPIVTTDLPVPPPLPEN